MTSLSRWGEEMERSGRNLWVKSSVSGGNGLELGNGGIKLSASRTSRMVAKIRALEAV